MQISDETKQTLREAHEDIRKATEEHFRESMNAPGYTYRDIPWLRYDLFQELVNNIIGLNEIKIIAMTEKSFPDGVFRRGQFMISPKGMENIRNYNVKKKEEAEDTQSNGDSS